MKNHFSLLNIAFTFFICSFLMIKNSLAEDQIVNTGNAVQFGVWKVYNAGADIYFVDRDASQFVINEFATNPPVFYTEKNRIFISTFGASIIHDRDLGDSTEKEVKAALAAKIKGQLQDGRYRFGSKRYVVSGDTVSIFNEGAEDSQGEVNVATILKKFSNGMVFNGPNASTIIQPTVMLDANAMPVPAKILGDCLATYSAETGRVEIPCLSIIGDTTVYHVGQQQIPDTLTFEVKQNDITPVQ